MISSDFKAGKRYMTDPLCAPCASNEMKEIASKHSGYNGDYEIKTLDAVGLRTLPDGFKTDRIGLYIPAVPDEEGLGFWGYTSIPDAGCAWWRQLPPLPKVGGSSGIPDADALSPERETAPRRLQGSGFRRNQGRHGDTDMSDPSKVMKFSYSNPVVPKSYKCAKCGAHGCKLYRAPNVHSPDVEASKAVVDGPDMRLPPLHGDAVEVHQLLAKLSRDAFWKEVAHGHYRAQCGALVGTAMLALMAALILVLNMNLDDDVNPLPTILKAFACLAIGLICCYMYLQLKTSHEPKKKDSHEDPTRLE